MPENRAPFQLSITMSPRSLRVLQEIVYNTYGMRFEKLIKEHPLTAYQVISVVTQTSCVRLTDMYGISVDTRGDGQEAVNNQVRKHRKAWSGDVIHITIFLQRKRRKSKLQPTLWSAFLVTLTDSF